MHGSVMQKIPFMGGKDDSDKKSRSGKDRSSQNRQQSRGGGGDRDYDNAIARPGDPDWDRFSGYPSYDNDDYNDRNSRRSRRPGGAMQRRASSLDRDQYSRDPSSSPYRPRRSGQYYSDEDDYYGDRQRPESGDPRRRKRRVEKKDDQTKLNQKWGQLSEGQKDATSALTAGLAGVAVIYGADRLYKAIKGQNGGREGGEGGERRRRASSSGGGRRRR